MAETFDQALHEEHEATDRDHEAKALADRLEDERAQLQAFADWMEQYSGESAVAKTFVNEAYLPIIFGGTIGFSNGKPIFPRAISTPYKALWAIYEKETRIA